MLTKKEISDLTEYAVSKGITWESAERMAFLTAEDQKKHEYWKQKALEAKELHLHTPIITPDVLKHMFDLEEGYKHEI